MDRSSSPGSPVKATLKCGSTHEDCNLYYFTVLVVTSFVLQNNPFTASFQQKSLFRFTEKAAEQVFTFKGKCTAKKGVSLGDYEFYSRNEHCALLQKPLTSLMRSTKRTLKVIRDALKR